MALGTGDDRVGQGRVRGAQSFVAGLALIALAAIALWSTSNLPQGTLRAMGPAMLPRWLAIGVATCGLALVLYGLLKTGEALDRWSARGPVFVIIGILLFAFTIRPFSFGVFTTPGLGLIGAGPLAMLVGGHATPEVRLRELVVLALALTAACMVLFGDLLNLPIPMFPQALADLFPAGWSNDNRIRAVAASMAVGAVAIGLGTGTDRSRAARIDVADHTVGKI